MKNVSRKLMYLKLTAIGLVVLVGLFGAFGVLRPAGVDAFSTGPPTPFTGAPSENDCSACHTGEKVNSGGGSVTVNGLPVNYIPNHEYPVTVTVNHFNAVLYGFEATSIDKDGAGAGSFILPKQAPAQMQLKDGFVEPFERKYIEHTLDGTSSATPNTKSWTFTWKAPATRIGKIGLYAAGNGANGDGENSGDFIYTGSGATYSGTSAASFDGDGKSDLSVFRPSSGTWFHLNSTDGSFNAVQFGSPGDMVVPGDFDGDGKVDRAVWRPSNGLWFILLSSNTSLAGLPFGLPGDIPAQGDYDGDGKTDLAIFRPSTGEWFVYLIGTGQFQFFTFGTNGDKPVPGDYDGDGKTDLCVFRQSTGSWFYLKSSNGAFVALGWGSPGDRPVPGDYDGDGKTDVAIYRPSNGVWFVLKSTGGVGGNQFGVGTDTPAPGDYDGDGITDLAIYRDGTWFVFRSSDLAVEVNFFGLAGDIPVAAGYAQP
jgi:FG-GAP-like repeat